MSLVTTTQTSAPRRGRRLLAGLSALVLALVLSGCAVFSQTATEKVYNPGDGSMVDLGPVQIRDLIVVGTAAGEPATVVAYVVNNSNEAVTVEFAGEGGSASAEVPARSAVQVSPVGEPGLQLGSLGVTPGSILPLTVTAGGNPPAAVGVQTITPDNPLYADYRAS